MEKKIPRFPTLDDALQACEQAILDEVLPKGELRYNPAKKVSLEDILLDYFTFQDLIINSNNEKHPPSKTARYSFSQIFGPATLAGWLTA